MYPQMSLPELSDFIRKVDAAGASHDYEAAFALDPIVSPVSVPACAFRRLQPSIPIETSHRFRLKPAGDSDDPSRVAARVASG
jgi:hypothetical protein